MTSPQRCAAQRAWANHVQNFGIGQSIFDESKRFEAEYRPEPGPDRAIHPFVENLAMRDSIYLTQIGAGVIDLDALWSANDRSSQRQETDRRMIAARGAPRLRTIC